MQPPPATRQRRVVADPRLECTTGRCRRAAPGQHRAAETMLQPTKAGNSRITGQFVSGGESAVDVPVDSCVKPASGLARYATALAISCGRP